MNSKNSGAAHQSLSAYFRDVRKTHPLTREEERKLGKRIQAGDLGARNELVTANLRFGVAMAKAYQGRGLSLDELISAANVGLIEAAARYDSRNGARFITYASWWIRRCVVRALGAHDKLVHLPAHVQDLIRKVKRTANELHEEKESYPVIEEIVARSGEPEKRVRMALENIQELESLDQSPDGSDDPERRLAGEIHDPSRHRPTVLEMLEAHDQVVSLMTELTERESAVIRLYYGLEEGGEGNLAAIGRSMELSRERVRQIKATALRRLREKAEAEEARIDAPDRLGEDENAQGGGTVRSLLS